MLLSLFTLFSSFSFFFKTLSLSLSLCPLLDNCFREEEKEDKKDKREKSRHLSLSLLHSFTLTLIFDYERSLDLIDGHIFCCLLIFICIFATFFSFLPFCFYWSLPFYFIWKQINFDSTVSFICLTVIKNSWFKNVYYFSFSSFNYLSLSLFKINYAKLKPLVALREQQLDDNDFLSFFFSFSVSFLSLWRR